MIADVILSPAARVKYPLLHSAPPHNVSPISGTSFIKRFQDTLLSTYESANILRGDTGIEVKTSRQPGGWQAHNPEKGWVMIFRYNLGQAEGQGRLRKTDP